MTNENENGQTSNDENVEKKPLTIGELLKLKRQERNLTLKAISQQTKIHISLLENLESNNLASLPSKAYVQGFVRSTAKILNLDSKVALAALEYTYNPLATTKATQAALTKKKHDESEHLKEDFKNKEFILLAQNFIAKHIGLAIKLFIVIAIIWGAVYYVSDYIKRLPPPVTVEKNLEENSEGNSEENLEAPNTSETTTSPAITTQETTTNEVKALEKTPEPPVETPVKVEEKAPEEKDPRVLKQVKLSSVAATEVQFEDLDLTTEDYNELLPAKFRVNVTPNTHAIFLNATTGDSWITYKVDDKEIKKFVLRQGRTLFMRGETVRLFLGNASTLNIFYNNRPVKVLTRSKSSIKNIVVPEEKKTAYKLPLFIFNDDGTVLTSDEYEKIMATQTTP